MNPDFWGGKRVFLTGHTGFKGSWLSLWLQRMGAEVTGYALLPPTNPSLFNVARVGEGMHSIISDIRNFDELSTAISACRPEIVFHMAAQPLVRYSYSNPAETYATNVMGTVNLLEAIRQTTGIKAVVNITTDKCYENREWIWGYREHEPMGGLDPYSSSKACSELITGAYRASYFSPNKHGQHGVAIASARAGNVIGGGDWATDRLIPDILHAIEAGTSIKIRNPRAIRPWQHVLEPLCGYLTLAEALFKDGSRYSEGWNFGPSDEDAKPVEWIVDFLVRSCGNGVTWSKDVGEHPHEALHLKLDISKARAMLNWAPRWNLNTTLEKVVAWHRAHRDGVDLNAFTLNQIKQYESSLV